MRKKHRWLRPARRPIWAAGVIVALIIVAVVTYTIALLSVLKPIARFATAQPQNATLVAALVALVGILITQIVNTVLARRAQKNQQELEERRARAASLQSYLEQMGVLVTQHGLRKWAEQGPYSSAQNKGADARVVATAQTLAVLEGLDSPRRSILLRFLYWSGLISQNTTRGVETISLRQANLSGIELSGADLSGAVLSGANLSGAVLRNVDLSRALLIDTDLSGADLDGAILNGAILRGTNMKDLELTEEQRAEAGTL
jgi:hypothetical protein